MNSRQTQPATERFIPLSAVDKHPALPLWTRLVVLLAVILLTLGAAISLLNPALLASPTAEITAAVRVYAGYTFSRDLALAVALLVALILRARSALNALLLLTGLIQLLDVLPDYLEHRYSLIPGILVLSILFFAAATAVSGAIFWKSRAWRAGV